MAHLDQHDQMIRKFSRGQSTVDDLLLVLTSYLLGRPFKVLIKFI